MEIKYTPNAVADIQYWKKSGNLAVCNKITKLLEDIKKHPFTGIGKPEALKHELAGSWSRRITLEHRLVYQVVNDEYIEIQSVRGHY
ncbi:Txe/YoeB family addiction module toxin [Flavobacterium sp. RSSA_27]|uniref:Txe/YoeB family addiction module toxin n=1 Tax=Flavobacterium sp. RSSA_27 TaxID=3447667 RepID=UPI003F389EBD